MVDHICVSSSKTSAVPAHLLERRACTMCTQVRTLCDIALGHLRSRPLQLWRTHLTHEKSAHFSTPACRRARAVNSLGDSRLSDSVFIAEGKLCLQPERFKIASKDIWIFRPDINAVLNLFVDNAEGQLRFASNRRARDTERLAAIRVHHTRAGFEDSDPYWSEVWASAIAIAEVMFSDPTLVAGKRVADVGCGLGLAGIAAALAGTARSYT